MNGPKRILYIENDKGLVESFREVVNDRANSGRHAAIQLTVAYHMQEAEELIGNKTPFDGYIIDIMLPRNQGDLERLERAEEKRMGLLDELIKSTDFEAQHLSDQTLRFRREIDHVDEEISRLVDEEGGVRLVELIAKKHCGKEAPEPLEVPVIFWTARAAPELKDKSRQYVEGKYFRWMEKPADEEEVFGQLVRLLALSGGA
jgi:CheY-like chemotaxis protein